MRIVSFQDRRGQSWGVLDDDKIIDLGRRPGFGYPTVADALRGGGLMDIAMEVVGLPATIELADVQLVPPVPNPAKILCIGLNYDAHATERRRPGNAKPTVFLRHADTLIGHAQPIVQPRQNEQLDFEGELAVVIGTSARHVDVERATEHVAGYTCFNEASVRDFQKHSSQFTAGKNFPATGACGPWIVTRDEVPQLTNREIRTRLNGQIVQHAALDDQIFSIAELIAYLSSWTELTPGDLVVIGTPGGVGAARQPTPLWMKPGYVCEVEINGIGTLANPITQETTSPAAL
jgi:2-keto-4-pentenoate hydratase/2-oxohepta-3-ene-1,7-dioic acid hydratase in catechol pathway